MHWRSVIGSSFAAVAAGTLYSYGMYSPLLKGALGYSESRINLIGQLGDYGLYLGSTLGHVFDRYGARITLPLSGLLLFTGYFCMFLSTEHIFGAT